jgi:hypothetical protein
VVQTATATGGTGGTGGTAGTGTSGPAKPGRGGTGGTALAEATATGAGTGSLDLSLTATGGTGGTGGSGANGGAGGSGGTATFGNIIATSTGSQTVDADLRAIGGNGGSAAGSGAGGNGGNVSILTSAGSLFLSTSGSINSVRQFVTGGNGGASPTGNGGHGGHADSIFALNQNGASSLHFLGSADGGSGASGAAGSAGFGGNTSSQISISGNADVHVTAWANASVFPGLARGGDITSGSGTAGAGGNATASGFAHSSGILGNADAQISVSAYGGEGGAILVNATGNGGSGGSAIVTGATANNNVADSTSAAAFATGGDGGIGRGASFRGGHGGNATMQSASSNSGGGDVTVYSGASGGDGGTGIGAGSIGGNGGHATLGGIAGYSTSAGDIELTGSAIGGVGGAGDSSGNGGNATASNSPVNLSGTTLTLTQRVRGGNAGIASNGLGGIGGSAYSLFAPTVNNPGAPGMSVTIYATAGSSGNSQNANGQPNRTAYSAFNLTSNGYASAIVGANTFSPDPTPSAGGVTSGVGNGGDGGGATASSFVSAAGINIDFRSSGTSGGSVTGSALGNGGRGGDAYVTGGFHALNASAAMVGARATGGTGGQASGSGFVGGAGGIPAVGPFSVSSDTGAVNMTLLLQGGAGGTGASGANGGNGASVALTNALTSATTGDLIVYQNATGGGGGGSNGGVPGTAGNGSSTLAFANTIHPHLTATADARGGFGGAVSNTNGASNGAATASAAINAAHNLTVFAHANLTGSSAGSVNGGSNGFSGGNGTPASAVGSGISTGTAISDSAVSVTATGIGGDGGGVLNGVLGNGGNGALGTATSFASGAGLDLVSATAQANGGRGGHGAGAAFHAGNSGPALANATASSNAGPVLATSSATAGTAGIVTLSALPGVTGSASSFATATGLRNAISTANASGTSGTAVSNARANATSGLFSFVQTIASSPAGTAVNTGATSFISQSQSAATFASLSTMEAASVGVGVPLATDVTARWGATANVRTAFGNSASNVTFLVMTNLANVVPGTTTSTLVELNENNAALGSGNLAIGLVSVQTQNSGLLAGDSLRFRTLRNGATIIDQTFATVSDFATWFNNTVVYLGAANAGLNGANLDLQFLFDLTSIHPGAGVGAQFLLGTSQVSPTGIWNNATGGAWTIPGNWTSSNLPLGAGISATFGSVITQPRTVTLNSTTTVGNLTFNNANPYTLLNSGGGILALSNGAQPATITLTAGNHTINAPLTFALAGLLIAPNGNTLFLHGSISGGAPLTLGAPGKIALLPNTGTAKVSSLTLPGTTNNWTGQLDLTSNALIVQTTGPADKSMQLPTLQNQIAYANVSGPSAWTGNGITSSTILTTPNTTLALADNADLGLTTFRGQNVDENSLIITQSLFGDATLDGFVDAFDLNLIAANWQKPANALWSDGDFTGDGTVDAFDLNLLASHWQLGASTASLSFPEALAQTPIPEPATLSLLALLPLLQTGGRARKRSRPDNSLNRPSPQVS